MFDFAGLFPAHTVNGAVNSDVGFRRGDKGTHTSRTMMLAELVSLLDHIPADAGREDYAHAIVEDNVLGKNTGATCKLTNQRLGELYGLDPNIQIFRVLRHLWSLDDTGRPLLAFLTAIARDPLLAGTANAILSLQAGQEFNRTKMRDALQDTVGERLNDSVLDKVVRNAASSWTQAGHLEGRTFKVRRVVDPSAEPLAFALFLAHRAGFRSLDLFTSGWVHLLDLSPSEARNRANEVKRKGLLQIRELSDVLEIGFAPLDPWSGGI